MNKKGTQYEILTSKHSEFHCECRRCSGTPALVAILIDNDPRYIRYPLKNRAMSGTQQADT